LERSNEEKKEFSIMKKILILSSIILLFLWITVVFAQDAQQEKETRILAAISFQDVIVIWFAGMLGGLANSLLAGEGWKSALVPNILLGGIAALIIYFLGGNELNPPKQVGAALLSGIGGSNIINSLRQRALMVLQNQAINSLTETTNKLLKAVETMTKIDEGGEHHETDDERNTKQETETGNQR
jgi:peptidoglycan/LPS O-acetylase OafA/YrhL